jgi:CopG family transcriptional regulator/antitoxin EndoAI
MSKRINIVLPELTIQTIDRMTKPGQRSRFIDQAVQHFVANRSAEALRVQLERATVRDQDLDRKLAGDWFAVDQESWQRLETSEQQRKPVTRDGEKSTSRRSTRR